VTREVADQIRDDAPLGKLPVVPVTAELVDVATGEDRVDATSDIDPLEHGEIAAGRCFHRVLGHVDVQVGDDVVGPGSPVSVEDDPIEHAPDLVTPSSHPALVVRPKLAVGEQGRDSIEITSVDRGCIFVHQQTDLGTIPHRENL